VLLHYKAETLPLDRTCLIYTHKLRINVFTQDNRTLPFGNFSVTPWGYGGRGILFIPGNVIAVGNSSLAKISQPYSFSADASGKTQEVLMVVEESKIYYLPYSFSRNLTPCHQRSPAI